MSFHFHRIFSFCRLSRCHEPSDHLLRNDSLTLNYANIRTVSQDEEDDEMNSFAWIEIKNSKDGKNGIQTPWNSD